MNIDKQKIEKQTVCTPTQNTYNSFQPSIVLLNNCMTNTAKRASLLSFNTYINILFIPYSYTKRTVVWGTSVIGG